jgi:hypothetical protein
MNHSEHPQTFDQNTLKDMLIKKNYHFGNSYYEPSNYHPIDKKHTIDDLTTYLAKRYQAGDKPRCHDEVIEKIIGSPQAKTLIAADRSEYFKVLTHFTILSQAKRGWFNLLITHPSKNSKPSLSANPALNSVRKSKKLNDALVYCYYNRLFEGMTEEDKKRYEILSPSPNELSPSKFDRCLFAFNHTLQQLINIKAKEIISEENIIKGIVTRESLLHLTKFARSLIEKIRWIARQQADSPSDTLRAELIKSASLNRAINDIDAILACHPKIKEIIKTLDCDLMPLKNVEAESEIIPRLSALFSVKQDDLPSDLIKCARLVCSMSVKTDFSRGDTKAGEICATEEYRKIIFHPSSIAIASALLYLCWANKTKISLEILGETNQFILVYKTLSDFAKPLAEPVEFNKKDGIKRGFPEPLSKYLRTFFVILESPAEPTLDNILGSLKYKALKLKIERDAYRMMKKFSVSEIREVISYSYSIVAMDDLQ